MGRSPSTEEGVAAVKKADPVLALLEKLPEADRKREEFFLCQSIDGYIGYIERKRDQDGSKKSSI